MTFDTDGTPYSGITISLPRKASRVETECMLIKSYLDALLVENKKTMILEIAGT